MNETAPENSTANPEKQAKRSWSFGWFAASLLATLALSLAAAHTPPRVRLIGLFSVVFGLIIGWMLVQLAKLLDVRPGAAVCAAMAALLTFAGLAGTTWEIMRSDLKNQAKSSKDVLAERLIEEMRTKDQLGISGTDSLLLADFRRHLSTRIRQLGEFSRPWPEIFWLSELVIAALASAWIARKSSKMES